MSDLLDDVPGLRPPRPGDGVHPSWYGYIVRYDPTELGGLPLARYHAALLAEGLIEADRPGSTCPLNQLPLFQNPTALFPDLPRMTAQAERDDIVQLVVGAVVRDGGNVLLLRRPADDFMGGIYELPSGKVDTGEDPRTALVREVKEETGLDIADVTGYLGSFDYLSGSGKASRQFTFTVEVATTAPVVLTEHDEHRWHPLTEDAPVTDAVKKILDTCAVA